MTEVQPKAWYAYKGYNFAWNINSWKGVCGFNNFGFLLFLLRPGASNTEFYKHWENTQKLGLDTAEIYDPPVPVDQRSPYRFIRPTDFQSGRNPEIHYIPLHDSIEFADSVPKTYPVPDNQLENYELTIEE